MTESEIMKALIFCKEQGLTSECTGCPYKGTKRDCIELILEDALALINRKNAEIAEKDAEIERFEKAIQVQEIMLGNQDYAIKKARAEAIKEFVMKAEGRSFFPETNDPDEDWEVVSLDSLYKIAKEMGVEL